VSQQFPILDETIKSQQ